MSKETFYTIPCITNRIFKREGDAKKFLSKRYTTVPFTIVKNVTEDIKFVPPSIVESEPERKESVIRDILFSLIGDIEKKGKLSWRYNICDDLIYTINTPRGNEVRNLLIHLNHDYPLKEVKTLFTKYSVAHNNGILLKFENVIHYLNPYIKQYFLKHSLCGEKEYRDTLYIHLSMGDKIYHIERTHVVFSCFEPLTKFSSLRPKYLEQFDITSKEATRYINTFFSHIQSNG